MGEGDITLSLCPLYEGHVCMYVRVLDAPE